MTAASTTTTHVFRRGACLHPHSAKRVVIGLKPAREYVPFTFCWVSSGSDSRGDDACIVVNTVEKLQSSMRAVVYKVSSRPPIGWSDVWSTPRTPSNAVQLPAPVAFLYAAKEVLCLTSPWPRYRGDISHNQAKGLSLEFLVIMHWRLVQQYSR